MITFKAKLLTEVSVRSSAHAANCSNLSTVEGAALLVILLDSVYGVKVERIDMGSLRKTRNMYTLCSLAHLLELIVMDLLDPSCHAHGWPASVPSTDSTPRVRESTPVSHNAHISCSMVI